MMMVMLFGFLSKVTSVKFAAEGEFVVTGSADKVIPPTRIFFLFSSLLDHFVLVGFVFTINIFYFSVMFFYYIVFLLLSWELSLSF